jgi:hypothetical protein
MFFPNIRKCFSSFHGNLSKFMKQRESHRTDNDPCTCCPHRR